MPPRPSLDSILGPIKSGEAQTRPSLDSIFASKPEVSTEPEQPPKTPLLTNPQGGLGTALKDVAVGAGKSLIGGARDVASGIQSLGKGTAGLLGVDTSKGGIKSIDNNTPEGQGVADSLAYKSTAEHTGGLLSDVAQLATPLAGGNLEKGIAKGKEVYDTYKSGKVAKEALQNGPKISEMISPKMTAKETKLAQTQGRIYDGKDPTLFKAGTEGKVATSDKVADATRTIMKKIPNAAKMSETELYSAVDESIGKTAKELRPQMEATPIKPETVEKITTDWEGLKKAQIENAPATEELNVAKRQAKFENFLKKSKSGNQADLWDTRIEYDNSIPENVKKANINSPESLQIQKEEWLQNRDVLNKAITDTTHGMGNASRQAFSDMTSMYEAKGNLLGKAKVNDAQLSKVNQFLKDNPKTAKVLGGATIYEVLKGLGIHLP